jgi:hypothetical protein
LSLVTKDYEQPPPIANKYSHFEEKKLCLLVKTERLRQPNLKITKFEYNIPFISLRCKRFSASRMAYKKLCFALQERLIK